MGKSSKAKEKEALAENAAVKRGNAERLARRACELARDGATARDVARRLGCSRNFVLRAMRRAGLATDKPYDLWSHGLPD